MTISPLIKFSESSNFGPPKDPKFGIVTFNSKFCDPLNEDQITRIHGRSLYGHIWEVGDQMGYVLVMHNPYTKSDPKSIGVEVICHTEVERFLSEYALIDNKHYALKG